MHITANFDVRNATFWQFFVIFGGYNDFFVIFLTFKRIDLNVDKSKI